MGLLDKDQGSITLNNENIDYNQTENIGFLTEERSLLTKLTVKEQAIFYGVLKGLKEKEIEGKLDILLERFSITEYKNRLIKELSKGNQQKIQFITAIINEPKLLILDEPFTGLDPINVELFMDVINELKEKGTSIIFSSHRMEHIEQFCENLVILVKGKPVLEGKIKDIKKEYRKLNIKVIGNVDIKKLETIKGVIKVIENEDEITIKIEDESIIDSVFDEVKKHKNITKFVVEEPTLNEIFISKVGAAYEN